MKNENKYYIPEINEFYIGYKCEFLESENDIMDWEKSTLTYFEFLKIEDFLNCNRVRTKYLDKEDIESLGFGNFEYSFYNNTNHITATKEKVKIKNYYNNKVEIVLHLDYSVENNHLLIDNGEAYDFNEIYFEGEVKSLNELTKILKMICY